MENLSLDTYNINFIDDIIEHNNLSKLDFPDLLDHFKDTPYLNTKKLCNAITYSKYQSLLNFVNLELHRLTTLKRGILEHAKQNFILNNAQCSFRKTINQTYHLYQKQGQGYGNGNGNGNGYDNNYLSIISKDEWGSEFQDIYLGSFKLNNDLTWEEV